MLPCLTPNRCCLFPCWPWLSLTEAYFPNSPVTKSTCHHSEHVSQKPVCLPSHWPCLPLCHHFHATVICTSSSYSTAEYVSITSLCSLLTFPLVEKPPHWPYWPLKWACVLAALSPGPSTLMMSLCSCHIEKFPAHPVHHPPELCDKPVYTTAPPLGLYVYATNIYSCQFHPLCWLILPLQQACVRCCPTNRLA